MINLSHSEVVRLVDPLFGSSSHSDVAFLLNLRVKRVKGLRIIIVKESRLSIVFSCNVEDCSYILRLHPPLSFLSTHLGPQSWCVRKPFFHCLFSIFSFLEGEIVFGFVPGLISPVSSMFLCISSLFVLTPAIEPVFESYSSAQVVPILRSIEGNETYEAPEQPTTLTDHPNVSLPHIVCNMEHHYN